MYLSLYEEPPALSLTLRQDRSLSYTIRAHDELEAALRELDEVIVQSAYGAYDADSDTFPGIVPFIQQVKQATATFTERLNHITPEHREALREFAVWGRQLANRCTEALTTALRDARQALRAAHVQTYKHARFERLPVGGSDGVLRVKWFVAKVAHALRHEHFAFESSKAKLRRQIAVRTVADRAHAIWPRSQSVAELAELLLEKQVHLAYAPADAAHRPHLAELDAVYKQIAEAFIDSGEITSQYGDM